jgi:hypothetical protein
MAANGISTLSTKELRQKAKLEFASADRAKVGNPRSVYNITQLPTQYDDNGIIDNANTGGLLLGRPWVVLAVNLYRRTYSGYFADDPDWFATATETAEAEDSTLAIGSIPTTTSYQYIGYFVPATTETYTFYTTSDDASYIWVGDTARSGFTTVNAIVNNSGEHPPQEQSGTIDLTAGVYYPIRIQVGNNEAGGSLSTSFSTPTISKTSTFTDRVLHDSISKGF